MTEMTINYTMKVLANIIFDNVFMYDGMAFHSLPIEEYINKAKFYMNEYGFATAKIVNAETNDTLVEMENFYASDEESYSIDD